jgi:hypothetical protein
MISFENFDGFDGMVVGNHHSDVLEIIWARTVLHQAAVCFTGWDNPGGEDDVTSWIFDAGTEVVAKGLGGHGKGSLEDRKGKDVT